MKINDKFKLLLSLKIVENIWKIWLAKIIIKVDVKKFNLKLNFKSFLKTKINKMKIQYGIIKRKFKKIDLKFLGSK